MSSSERSPSAHGSGGAGSERILRGRPGRPRGVDAPPTMADRAADAAAQGAASAAQRRVAGRDGGGSGAARGSRFEHPTTAALGVELGQARRIAEARGYADGHARASAELESAIASAGALAERLELLAPRESTTLAHTVAELALAIARRIVGSALAADPSVLIDTIETAVAAANGSPTIRVSLHPSAVGPVETAWVERYGRGYLGKSWSFEADPLLPPGGCQLRFEHGFVDAGLEAQLEEIGMALDAAIPAYVSELTGERAVAAVAGAFS